jgi:tetratricopeptide (TPR) repeat protein
MNALNVWYFRQMAIWSAFVKRDGMALAYWERLGEARPRDAKVIAKIAHLRAGLGEREAAIALLRRALDIDPDSAPTWFNLGYLQQESGAHEDALESFGRAIALDEKLDRAWYGKALSLIKLGRLDEAVAPLKRNTELQPMSPFGWYQLAHVHHRQGDSRRVAKIIRKLSEFEPKVARQLEQETGVSAGVDIPF